MNKRLVILIPFIILMGLPVGCKSISGPDLSDRSCPPTWYITLPQPDDQFVYAVGQSGPTIKPYRSKLQALQRAIESLAGQAQIYVKSEMVMRENMDKVIFSEKLLESKVRGMIKNYSLVAEHRCIANSDHTCPDGTTYVLLRINKSDLKIK